MENERLNTLSQEMKTEAVKSIVRLTLEQINELEIEKNKIQNKIKVLKHNLFDLKDGRLDRILERQELTPPIEKLTALITIKKCAVKNAKDNPWYIEYEISYWPEKDKICVTYLNNSTIKTHASGSYKLKDGSIKYL